MTEWVEEDDGSWTLRLSLGSLRICCNVLDFWVVHAAMPPFRHGVTWIVGRRDDNIEDVQRAAIGAALRSLDEARAELRILLRSAKTATHQTAKRAAR